MLSDLAEGMADLRIEFQDSCGGQNIQVEYTLFLDLNGDDTSETVVQSKVQQMPGKVLYNNYLSPNYSLGDTIVFDARAGVPDSMKYRFGLELSPNGGSLTAHLKWITGISALNYSAAQLPLGKHRIEWRIEQGGVEAFCAYNFEVKDCAPPVVKCFSSLSVNILPPGKIELWASDFVWPPTDNITPYPLLGTRKLSDNGSGFPVDSNGAPIVSVIFKCFDAWFTPQIHTVEVWARDRAGNVDSCHINVSVGLGGWDCNFDPAIVTGCARNELEETVEAVQYTAAGTSSFAPPFTLTLNSDIDLCAWFIGSIPSPSNFTLTPFKNDNPLNGVTTYDLVLISKHILSYDTLESPYRIIAADVNKSGSITTFDILELRKLILGIKDTFSNNTSWRFIPKDFSFPNALNPFQTGFPEFETLQDWIGPVGIESYFFTGIKIGDVNNTAIPNANAPLPVESRAAKFLLLPDQELKAGESIEIPIRSLENSQWLGLQFGLDFDPELLEIESVESSSLPDFEANNWAQIWPGQLTLSWSRDKAAPISADQELLRLRVKAKANTALSTAFKTPLEYRLQPEAYDLEGLIYPIQFVFSEKNSLKNTQIFAPQPNPTIAGTSIPVQLAQAGKLHLKLCDLSGKVLWINDLSLDKGSHFVEIPAKFFPQSGLYFWSIQTEDLLETGKIKKF